jgi:hypothetical protein
MSPLFAVLLALACAANAQSVTSWKGEWRSDVEAHLKWNIAGYEPSASGKYPVYIWTTGTEMGFDTPADDDLIKRMAEKGFVAAQCQYANYDYPFTCAEFEVKAKDIYEETRPESCLAQVCARSKANCALGIAVEGFSQGAQLSSLSAYTAKNVSAAYLRGNGNSAVRWSDLADCMDYLDSKGNRNPKHALDRKQVRSVSGEHDEFFGCCFDKECCGNKPSVHEQLANTTGYDCSTGMNCLQQTDGSGWFVVSDAQSAKNDGADHCYAYKETECLSNKAEWNPAYISTDPSCTWCIDPMLSWLASTAKKYATSAKTSA